jgi:hypothetical protein
VFTELPADHTRGDTQTHEHRVCNLTTEELSEVLSSLQPDPKLREEDNSVLRTVISSQSQHAETQ